MTKVMTPSNTPITLGQIGKIQELLGARLRKSDLQSDPTQQVLAIQGDAIADEMVAAIRRRVEAVSNMIVRRVKVDRSRLPQAMLDATGRAEYTDREVVDTMPRGEGEEIDVFFFKPDPSVYKDGVISCEEVERQYELRGLKPDSYAQGAVNEADPAFANEHPNGSQWKDADGNYCYAAFDHFDAKPWVNVDHINSVWNGVWLFAGVRK